MTIEHWVSQRGGAVRTSEAYAAGFGKYLIANAVRGGSLERVRRSWLLSSDCDPRRRSALRVGGRVTCVSAAALCGLWTPDHDRIHVAVHTDSGRIDRSGLRLHWASGPVPVPRNHSEDPLLTVLFHIARCLPQADALAVWESAIRQRSVSTVELRRVRWRSQRAQTLAELADDLSDSGLESRFRTLMRTLGVTIRQQARVDGRRVDALIGQRLVVQLDGFAFHTGPQDRRRDLEADARLALRGFTVLRFDYQQILFRPEYVSRTVLTAIAQDLHGEHR